MPGAFQSSSQAASLLRDSINSALDICGPPEPFGDLPRKVTKTRDSPLVSGFSSNSTLPFLNTPSTHSSISLPPTYHFLVLTHHRCFSVRMKISPFDIAGDALHRS